MEVKIEASWKEKLQNEFGKEYFEQLAAFVKEEYTTKKIFPEAKAIFRAFELCPFDEVKVVILGQDPYHKVESYNADGLAFSVKDTDRIPPSLLNMFKELQTDLGIERAKTGNLERWAKQGVLLLNTTLTVRAGLAGSHHGKGWEKFTDSVIKTISDERENIVFILWGSPARKKAELIDKGKHFIIESAHPSPLSADRGFFGSKPFSKTNDFLKSKGLKVIEW